MARKKNLNTDTVNLPIKGTISSIGTKKIDFNTKTKYLISIVTDDPKAVGLGTIDPMAEVNINFNIKERDLPKDEREFE